jgi:hypothetical protein
MSDYIDSSKATDWREGRRLRAFELKQQGWSQQNIARALPGRGQEERGE